MTGDFPIGFLLWQTSHGDGQLSQITEISVDVLNKDAQPIGEKKFYNIPSTEFLNSWLERLKTNTANVPLKNAVVPQTAKAKVTSWLDSAIGYFWCNSNDLQQANQTAIFSSVFSAGNGYYITKENLEKVTLMYTVRRVTKKTWQNDRDQFLQPTGELTDEFKNDCLMWMLFNGSNLTASTNDLEWNDKKWSIVNHFIPYREEEVGAPARFESDFMVRYMAGKQFSPEAQAVLAAGREIWRAYYLHTDPHTVREELKLNRVDVGWYQIRKAIEARNASGDFAPVSFDQFKSAYTTLTDKLRPQVYELGFLKE